MGREETGESSKQNGQGQITVLQTSFAEYNTSSNFCDWLERLEIHFADQGATDNEEKKKSILLKSIGSEPYSLVRSLCDPKKPAEKTYKQLIELLDAHYTPPSIIFRERLNFYAAIKDRSESVTSWFARVKKLAMSCKFEALEEIVRDKFVTGLATHEKIFDRLCEETAKLTSTDALKKAMVLETKFKANDQTVNFIKKTGKFSKGNKGQSNTSKGQGSSNGAGDAKTACSHCGWRNHASASCRFKDNTCNICGKRGHMANICRNKSDKKSNSNTYTKTVGNIFPYETNDNFFSYSNHSDGASYSMYMIKGTHSSDASGLNIAINGISQRGKCDTGSPCSLMSIDLFDRHYDRGLLTPCSGTPFKDYGGHPIPNIGEFIARITCGDQTRHIRIIVTRYTNRPLLLGDDFLSAFGFKLTSNGKSLSEFDKSVNSINNSTSIIVDQLKSEFSEVFKSELGTYTGTKVHLEVNADTRPIFCKPRPIPFAWKDKVEAQLNNLVKLGMLEPVENSDWGTPLVPILKPNGDIRICGDYKVTINKHLVDYKYPLPRIEEIFASLQGGELFSKLDLASAYNQLVLDESSQDLCTWSTHLGVFRMKRLPFGIKTAGAIFQKNIETLLKDIPNCINFMDDIVVTGKDYNSHIKILKIVLNRLQSHGLRLNADKCKFFQDKITYLGFNIDKNGLSKNKAHVESVLNAPIPKDVSETRAFIGMCNFYSTFIPDFTNKINPLYELLRKDAEFSWNKRCQDSYELIKKEVASDRVLVHFDPNKPIILTTDAANSAVAGILSHEFSDGSRRPIAFISRALTKAERNYSTIQKEALAIIFSVIKLRQYLLGINFVIETDHKPLLSIFGEDKGLPLMAAARMQRWALILSGFTFKIKYVKGILNIADTLSRMPQNEPIETPEEANYINFIKSNDHFRINYKNIAIATRNDPILSKLFDAIQSGNVQNLHGSSYKPFHSRSSELSVEHGCILWGYRTIIPSKFREQVLLDLHRSHLGIVKTKSLARSYIWWPGLDKEIENLIKSCNSCQLTQVSPEKGSLIPWNPTNKPWSRIHVDYAGPIHGQYLLIIIDSYSKWVEIFLTKTITSIFTIRKLREVFSRYGLVDTIVSDNGRQFTSDEFRVFTENNQIKHIFTAPGHPSTNGQAENFVKTVKKCIYSNLKEASPENIDIFLHRFLLDYRSSKHCTTGDSPAKLMFNRELKTRFSLLKPPTTREKIICNQENQIKNYHGKREVTFKRGQKVLARDYSNPNKEQWQKAVIKECLGPRNYTCILVNNERLVKRHTDQLRVRHDPNDRQLNVSENTGLAESNSFTNVSDVSLHGVDANREYASDLEGDTSHDTSSEFHDALPADRPSNEPLVRDETVNNARPVRSSALQAMIQMEELRASKQI